MPTPTLWLIVVLVICLLMTGVTFSLYRTGIAGVRMFAWAAAVSSAGVAFNTAIPLSPGLPLGLAGSTLFGVGMPLSFVALRQFFGLSVPWRPLIALTVVFVAALVLYYYVWPDWATRTATVSALRGLMSLLIAVLVLRRRPRHRPAFPYLFTVVMAAGLGLMHTWRASVYFLRLDAINALSQGSTVQNIYFIVGLVTLPGVLLGIVMMVHDRMLDQRANKAATGSTAGGTGAAARR
ncbi:MULTISPECIES: hypothetical protein [unclassified Achromobacter]|uniref:hypothetical protein n=1 Tax=unclassified Achromobacter TaxID=2626865 RepID=UPI000B51E024|nr:MULTISPECIES: hypothetical protein [unclassified Achromobacter]OWT80021.1 hypothetical protein CEY05_00900 [Achromobacter sp. HZ34]OWT81905.1 hypothetical protein CEY04_00900 [Achromobacter sp. HZ28]